MIIGGEDHEIGIGLLINPKKSLYNRVYRRTTFGLADVLKFLFGK